MSGQQFKFRFDAPHEPAPVAPSEIRDEIARVWDLPIDQTVVLTLRGQDALELKGRLELVAAPDLPWNKREVLRLRVGGVYFRSVEIDRWRLAE